MLWSRFELNIYGRMLYFFCHKLFLPTLIYTLSHFNLPFASFSFNKSRLGIKFFRSAFFDLNTRCSIWNAAQMHWTRSHIGLSNKLMHHRQNIFKYAYMLRMNTGFKFVNDEYVCPSKVFKIHNGRKLKIDVTNPSKSECIEMA